MSELFPRDPRCPQPAEKKPSDELLAVSERLLALDIGAVFLPMRPPHVSPGEWRAFNRGLDDLQLAVDGLKARAN